MLDLSTILLHYKRKEIQEKILEEANNKEVGVNLNNKGFAKRPEILMNPNDVLEFVKLGASSFHLSEELWENPMNISTNMKKQDIDKLRKGWDLVLDIDCKIWEYAKQITHLIIQCLKEHNVKAISAKFSGNKGFHVAVPFQAFPETVNGKPTKELFPEAPRRIANYLIHCITPKFSNYVNKDQDFEKKIKQLDKSKKDLTKIICKNCNLEKKEISQERRVECPYCGTTNTIKKQDNYFTCHKCNKLQQIIPLQEKCPKCGSKEFTTKVDLMQIMELDTLLISSRHLYRSCYSLHEKSGLCSIPIDENKILEFEKSMAKLPVKISKINFLDRNIEKKQANKLIIEAFDFQPKIQRKELTKFKEIKIPEEAIPQDLFPPCIKIILNGLDDGRKRSMFILTNFLQSCGWGKDQIQELLQDWNKKNNEELKQGMIDSHLRYHLKEKAKLPPNCDNKGYYKDMQFCKPDQLCKKIKNPVQYAKWKAKSLQKKSSYTKLTKEQKEMRKQYRKKKREEKKEENGEKK